VAVDQLEASIELIDLADLSDQQSSWVDFEARGPQRAVALESARREAEFACREADRLHLLAGRGREGGGMAQPPPAAPLSKLESTDNKVTTDLETVVLAEDRCRARSCSVCAIKRGWIVRQRLLARGSGWKRPAVLTLTVDREAFSSPVQAYRAVTRKKLVWRLMRALGVKRWFWVLEYQQKTGAGWPHWHILIDLNDVPGGRVNLGKAWELWRDTWGVGGLQLEVRDVEFHSVEHALMYISKYLMKQPEGGFPTWVLKSRQSIRFFQGCRLLGPLVGKSSVEREPPVEDQEVSRRAARRPLLDRMSECQVGRGRVFALRVDPKSGEQRSHFIGALPCSPGRVASLVASGQVSASIEVLTDEHGRETLALRSDPVGLLVQLRRLRDELREEVVERSRFKRRLLLEENKFAKREAVALAVLSRQADET